MATDPSAGPSPLDFTWQGFVFALANFLILVGLLYKFLHKPLLAVLEKRRQSIADAHKKARDEADKAQDAWKEYQAKLSAIQEERDRLLSETRRDAEEAGERMIASAREEAGREVANLKRAYDRERHDALKDLEEDIAGVSLDLARGVLEKLVDTDVDARLHAHLLEELDGLASGGDERAGHDLTHGEAPVRVLSARQLGEPERAEIAKRLEALTDDEVRLEFDTDADLIAGTRVEFSAMAVDATLSEVLATVRERIAELAADTEEGGEHATQEKVGDDEEVEDDDDDEGEED